MHLNVSSAKWRTFCLGLNVLITQPASRHNSGQTASIDRGSDGQLDLTRQSLHYNDVIMEAIASQITSLTIVYSIVYSEADQRKHQSSASLAFVWGIHRGPVNSPHKWPVTRKMFPFDDVIMFKTTIPSECTSKIGQETIVMQRFVTKISSKVRDGHQ